MKKARQLSWIDEAERLLASEDSPFRHAIPGFSIRKEQVEMARQVATALRDGSWKMIEAGTGVGKSLAYLIPAAFWARAEGKRVIVSTYTKTLQDQLIRKDLEALRKALSTESIGLSCALLMGSNNYLCTQRLKHALGDSHLLFDSRKDASAVQKLAAFSPEEWSGRRQDLPFPVESDVWSKVCRDPRICLGRKGSNWSHCYWKRAIEEARDAQILVINHALFFANESLEGGLLPPHDALIFDEAHRLEEAFLSFASEEISNFGLRHLLEEIHADEGRKGLVERLARPKAWKEVARTLVRSAHPLVRDFFDQLLLFVGGGMDDRRERSPFTTGTLLTRRITTTAPDGESLVNVLRQLGTHLTEAARISKTDEEEREIASLSEQCEGAARALVLILSPPQGDNVHWAEAQPLRSGHRVSLRSSPIEVGARFHDLLSEKPRAVIFTSATLTTNRSFSYIRSQLGLKDLEGLTLDSPFDYKKQAMLYISRHVPDPRATGPSEYLDRLESECAEILSASGGGTFFLFTNYKHLQAIDKRLRTRSEFKDFLFFAQGGSETTTQLLESFRESKRGALLGTMTFWQGVDVPGEALRCVVITKLPFEPPDHPLAMAREELIASRGGSAFGEYALPQAILLLRQGVGRLIRTVEDRGVIAILDSRVLSKSYGARFLHALPAMPRTESVRDVESFFKRTRS